VVDVFAIMFGGGQYLDWILESTICRKENPNSYTSLSRFLCGCFLAPPFIVRVPRPESPANGVSNAHECLYWQALLAVIRGRDS